MIYPYHCDRCGTKLDRICSLREYEMQPVLLCTYCQEPMTRTLTAPRTLLHTKPFESFKSPVDGSIINSRRELAEHNKRNNVQNVHDGYDEKAVQNFTKTDWQKPLDDERRKDLKEDMLKAINKCEEGYKPQTPSEAEIIPE